MRAPAVGCCIVGCLKEKVIWTKTPHICNMKEAKLFRANIKWKARNDDEKKDYLWNHIDFIGLAKETERCRPRDQNCGTDRRYVFLLNKYKNIPLFSLLFVRRLLITRIFKNVLKDGFIFLKITAETVRQL